MADPTSPVPPESPQPPESPESPRHVTDHEPLGEGHTGSGGIDDRTVPWRVFLTVGSLIAVVAAIYWFTSYEDAGSVLLTLAAVLALWCGAYLWLQLRAHPTAGETVTGPQAEAPTYLPHASVWPLTIGLGVATVLNGLVLGIWVVVPGVTLLALGVGGWVLQTRRRD